MKQPAVGFSLLLLALVLNACHRDDVTGLPALAASNEADPRKLTDAIAFFTRQFNAVDGGLAVMNADGSNRRPVPGSQNAFEPSISPDGRRIAFSRGTSLGVAGIFTMNVDGTGETTLGARPDAAAERGPGDKPVLVAGPVAITANLESESNPRWSPTAAGWSSAVE